MSRSALLGETGRIPVSGANEPAGRNPVGGTGKAERRRTQGAARRLGRQAQRCPVKVGGKVNNDNDGLEEEAVARREVDFRETGDGKCGTLLSASMVTRGIFAAKPDDL